MVEERGLGRLIYVSDCFGSWSVVDGWRALHLDRSPSLSSPSEHGGVSWGLGVSGDLGVVDTLPRTERGTRTDEVWGGMVGLGVALWTSPPAVHRVSTSATIGAGRDGPGGTNSPRVSDLSY